MTYKIGICDDEVYQVKINSLYLKEIAKNNNYEMEYIGFDKGTKVLSYLLKNKMDILFLDIDLGKDSGIAIAAEIIDKYPEVVVVFVTGHREFANEAFEVEAMGYIVKPVDIKKMESILKKAILQVNAIKNQKVSNTLVITEENLKKKINQYEIKYIQRQQTKSIIFTQRKQYQVYETITSLFQRLDHNFMRVNQSEIVNVSEVRELNGNMVVLKNGINMPIGRTFRKAVLNKYFNAPAK